MSLAVPEHLQKERIFLTKIRKKQMYKYQYGYYKKDLKNRPHKIPPKTSSQNILRGTPIRYIGCTIDRCNGASTPCIMA